MCRYWALLLLAITSCASTQPQGSDTKYLPFDKEFIYLSSDLDHVAVFSKDRTCFGPTDLTIVNKEWPASPAIYFETSQGVRCVSIGTAENSSQYAIKRPIKTEEQYSCLGTTFRVVRCFDNCKAAIIEKGEPMSGSRGGTYNSYMYVENCRGLIVLGVVSDLRKGIPLNAEWLRGEVGILAHPDYPRCRPF
jgi:hypothetical protein